MRPAFSEDTLLEKCGAAFANCDAAPQCSSGDTLIRTPLYNRGAVYSQLTPLGYPQPVLSFTTTPLQQPRAVFCSPLHRSSPAFRAPHCGTAQRHRLFLCRDVQRGQNLVPARIERGGGILCRLACLPVTFGLPGLAEHLDSCGVSAVWLVVAKSAVKALSVSLVLNLACKDAPLREPDLRRPPKSRLPCQPSLRRAPACRRATS